MSKSLDSLIALIGGTQVGLRWRWRLGAFRYTARSALGAFHTLVAVLFSCGIFHVEASADAQLRCAEIGVSCCAVKGLGEIVDWGAFD